MIIIYLIVIIFVLLLVILNKKEFFNEEIDNNFCKYLAWGPSFDSCIANCMSSDRIGLWDNGTFCDEDTCRNICVNCEHERCEWLSTWDKKEAKKLKIKNKQEKNELVPKSATINGISYQEKLTLTWENNEDADKYMLHCYNLNDSTEKVKIIPIQKSASRIELNKKDLSNNPETQNDSVIEYLIVLYSLNKFGISEPSNSLRIRV